MHRALTVLGTSALLGASMLIGSPAFAADMPGCPPGMHLVMTSANTGNCEPDAAPAPTAPIVSGNNWSIWASQPSYAPGPPPVQPPAYKPLPAPAAPEVPGRVIQPPAGEARPGSAVAGSSTGPNWSPTGAGAARAGTGAATAGETLQSQTPVEGAAPVQEQAPAEAPPAVVMPATEAQAVNALRSATATAAEKTAAMEIVKARIDAVLTSALARH